jgi:CBS domain-containing protein
VVLGIICGIAAIGFASALRRLEEFFDHMKKIPTVFHPALGALGLGIVGYFFPRVFGPGYATISDVLNVRMALTAVLLLLVFKAAVVLLSLGSGTSGGTLAPMFMMSAALGSTFAMIVNLLVPGAHLSVGAYAVAAMGALLCACARATFTFMFCAIETTHDFHAVVPVILVCVIADAIAVRYMPHSIMTERLARMGLGTGQDYEANSLKQLRVSDVMVRDVATVLPEETVRSAADRFANGDLKTSRHHALPIVDADGHLQGLVTQGDLLRSLQENPQGETRVLDAGTRSLVVAYPEERVFDAVSKMLENNIGRLPVVDRKDPQKMVGYINRANVMGSWRGHLSAESVREHGWLRNLRTVSDHKGNRGVAVGLVMSLKDDEILLAINSDANSNAEGFELSAPVRGVFLGDRVRVSYRQVKGHKIAVRVEELSSRQ